MVDLSTLEFPRHVHKYGGVSQIVPTALACLAALEAGWELLPPQRPPGEVPPPLPPMTVATARSGWKPMKT